MSSKNQILKMLEGRIDTMQNLAIEGIELIWQAAYNEAIEASVNIAQSKGCMFSTTDAIRKLKK